MDSTSLSFIDCATFLDMEAAIKIDQEQGSCVAEVLGNIQTYHMEYDAYTASEKLPRCFYRDFGDLINEYVVLRDPNNNEIEVQIVKRCKELYFARGWNRLREVYDLEFGGWVDFNYVNPDLLNIRLRTKCGNQVEYPNHNPPLKFMLSRVGSDLKFCSSALSISSDGCLMPTSFVRCYFKAMTAYDVQSGILVLPWYGFGDSAFAYTFSDLVLVDHIGCRYACRVNFGVDANGELACKVWGGWADICRKYRLTEGDRIRFAVTRPVPNYVMYVCIYPQIGIETTLSYPLSDGSYLPLYISQQYFVAHC